MSRSLDPLLLAAVGGALALSVAVACGTDHFATTPADAGPDAQEQADGGAADGGPTLDSASDGPDLSNDHFCQHQSPAPSFCLDFDDGVLTRGFAGGNPVVIAPPKLDPGTDAGFVPGARSSKALRLSSVGADGGDLEARYQNFWNITNAETLHVRAEVNIAAPYATASGADQTKLFGLSAHNGASQQVDAWVSLHGTQNELLFACSVRNDPAIEKYADTTFPLPDGWVTLEVDVDFKQAPLCQLRINPDGTNTLVSPTSVPTAPFSTSLNADFFVGLDVISPMAASDVTFDNVVFDGK